MARGAPYHQRRDTGRPGRDRGAVTAPSMASAAGGRPAAAYRPEVARQRGEPLEYVAAWPPGLGKTTLAHIIRHYMDVERHLRPRIEARRRPDGPAHQSLMAMSSLSMIIVDPAVENTYPAMDDFIVDFVVDKGANARCSTSLRRSPRRRHDDGRAVNGALRIALSRYRMNYYTPDSCALW